MVARASVTRELGSPAALLDLSARNSRRSSSRASQRTAPVPELSASNLTQSSYSLPPTPLTSSFDELLPSAKRRRTQRAIYSEDKTLPSKGVLESPTLRAFSEPFRTPKSRNSSKIVHNQKSAQPNTESEVNDAPSDEATAPSPTPNPATTSEQQQTIEETITPKKPPPRLTAITVKPEPDTKDTSTDSPTTMGSALSHNRKTRKSMSTRLDSAATQANGITPSKPSVSRTSTPQTSRRDRSSRLAANTGANITKPSPTIKAQSTPTAADAPQAIKTGTRATKSATPAKQPQSATPNTSTRSRRERKSTRANGQTPSLNHEAENVVSTVSPNKNNGHRRSQPSNRPSNTVTLNIGRKSLESIIAQQNSHNHETQNDIGETSHHVDDDDYHFEYDSEMYKNNFGLDGHIDAPSSPTSLSTTTSNAARASGRARKPTVRALESFESEQRYRRPRAASAKPPSTTEGTNNVKTRSKQKPAPQEPISTSTPDHQPDIKVLAKLIYELAAAAVAPDFVPAPEVQTWVKELQHKVDEQRNKKEVGPPEPTAEEAEGGEESRPTPSKPFLDNVQASDPRTDVDGWMHTGQVNPHGEEYVIVPPEYEWYRPNNTYGDKDLPLPPVRLRSMAQAEKDRVYGYPPRIGDRNLPADDQGFFLLENVPEEKAKLTVKEAARARGIYITKFMPLEEIEGLINLHENGQPAVSENLPAENTKEPSRKRRRTETTSATKLESADTQKPKRRRQETDTASPPEPSAPEPAAADPSSPEKRSLKIILTFENKRFLLEEAIANDSSTDQSKKRPHSDIEEDNTHSHDTRSPKMQRTSATTDNNTAESAQTPSTPAKATADKAEQPNATHDTPDSADQYTETTPGGRPRRRATNALMAGFQRHAEDRARRSERARLGHARKRGTPLKNVIGVHGDTVDSPIRPSMNPMNLD
ncbi:hypothetical protein BDW59DRAFT_151879 [Aspergillus cavernicola]|uniref:GPI-anchored cell surface glycoprotein n=1 Tax=Aspergillus cavernicola TaxID=176166 RepID=A0ABR4HTJ9_9EURO